MAINQVLDHRGVGRGAGQKSLLDGEPIGAGRRVNLAVLLDGQGLEFVSIGRKAGFATRAQQTLAHRKLLHGAHVDFKPGGCLSGEY